MAVVINDFEVVPPAPAAAQQETAGKQRAPEGPPPQLEREIERAARRQRIREARLRAD